VLLAVHHDSSGAEALAKRIRKARLAFCGNDAKAKLLTATLIRDVGFEPVDCGALKTARYTEPFALLVAELAYGGKTAAELVYRFEYAVRTPAAPAEQVSRQNLRRLSSIPARTSV